MNKKILIGIIAGLGMVLMILNPFVMGIFAIAFWACLVLMIRKRKSIFHEQTDPRLAEKSLKRLKAISIVAGISCLVSIGGIIVHNVRSNRFEIEENLYFIIGFVALYVFIMATAGGLVIFLRERKKQYRDT